MEVTLEKIELVKDRTGVTYKEAKEALEAADGNVVDAIVAIEDKTDGQTSSEKIGNKGSELVEKMKEVVQRGNVARILVKKDDDTLLNLPLNAGVVGAVVAPWGVILGVAASFGFNCKIEFIKDDGGVIDITDKAGNIVETAKEKGNEVYEQVREKTPALDDIKEKGEAALNKAKEFAEEAKNKFQKKADDVEEAAKDAADDLQEKADEIKDAADDAAKDAAEKAEDAAKDTVDLTDIKDEDL